MRPRCARDAHCSQIDFRIILLYGFSRRSPKMSAIVMRANDFAPFLGADLPWRSRPIPFCAHAAAYPFHPAIITSFGDKTKQRKATFTLGDVKWNVDQAIAASKASGD